MYIEEIITLEHILKHIHGDRRFDSIPEHNIKTQ